MLGGLWNELSALGKQKRKRPSTPGVSPVFRAAAPLMYPLINDCCSPSLCPLATPPYRHHCAPSLYLSTRRDGHPVGNGFGDPAVPDESNVNYPMAERASDQWVERQHLRAAAHGGLRDQSGHSVASQRLSRTLEAAVHGGWVVVGYATSDGHHTRLA